MKRHVHVISHTHWDREWYLPYEKHHLKLIQLMNVLLDLLEQDSEFRSFHLDGQTIVLDDYLQVHPEKRPLLEKYIQEGRLIIGPWYILQDEFLTSSEANARNLLIGHRDAVAFGPIAKIGYFPDSFGNMGQAPQLMRQAGIDNAVFGRGVKPTGFNNTVSDGSYESPFSEMVWQSPDGSEVLGILFANWYCNGMEVPVDPIAAAEYWTKRIQDAERYASTPHLLFMNGCDHQPVQTDLSAALANARELIPDIEWKHSNFPDYVQALHDSPHQERTVIRGELRSQRTDGWWTLVNTASSRIYLKQANQECQALLEKAVEPLAVLASSPLVTGTAASRQPYPHALLVYNWKTLMQNHPHDSICGCSVDEVHREMVTRFEKSRHLSEGLVSESAAAIASSIDTSCFAAYPGAVPFVVFNTSGSSRTGVVSASLEVERLWFSEGEPAKLAAKLAKQPVSGRIIDADGNRVDAELSDLGVKFGYTLPEDRFRQPYMSRAVQAVIQAKDIPALGYAVYAWIPEEASLTAEAAAAAETIEPPTIQDQQSLPVLDNSWLTVNVKQNGTFTLFNKRTGRTFEDLGYFENVGDIGNEYIFRQPDGEAPLTTLDSKPAIRTFTHTPLRTVVEIAYEWTIPAGADAMLEHERQYLISITERTAQRSSDQVSMPIQVRLTLESDSQSLGIEVSFDNQAKDHRLRMMFPSDLLTDVHHADSIYEVACRDNTPAPEWQNPSNCQHQQAFVALDEAAAGLAVLNKGLNEYEVLRDDRRTIAITVHRGTGELGDWGVFPTPEAQCLGEQRVQLALHPYAGADHRHEASAAAAQYHTPWTVTQTDVHTGPAVARFTWLDWEGATLVLSAVKRHEGTEDTILRWYNTALAPAALTIKPQFEGQRWYRSNILEEQLEELPLVNGVIQLEVRAAEIVTLRCDS